MGRTIRPVGSPSPADLEVEDSAPPLPSAAPAMPLSERRPVDELPPSPAPSRPRSSGRSSRTRRTKLRQRPITYSPTRKAGPRGGFVNTRSSASPSVDIRGDGDPAAGSEDPSLAGVTQPDNAMFAARSPEQSSLETLQSKFEGLISVSPPLDEAKRQRYAARLLEVAKQLFDKAGVAVVAGKTCDGFPALVIQGRAGGTPLEAAALKWRQDYGARLLVSPAMEYAHPRDPEAPRLGDEVGIDLADVPHLSPGPWFARDTVRRDLLKEEAAGKAELLSGASPLGDGSSLARDEGSLERNIAGSGKPGSRR